MARCEARRRRACFKAAVGKRRGARCQEARWRGARRGSLAGLGGCGRRSVGALAAARRAAGGLMDGVSRAKGAAAVSGFGRMAFSDKVGRGPVPGGAKPQ